MKDIFAKHGLNCPVTHGLATRLSRESFAAACDARRDRAKKERPGGAFFLKICLICNGNHQPQELEIIDMSNKMISGSCEACGEENKNLSANRGKKICATCAKIYSYASLRKRVVLAALQELHGDWLTDQVGMPVPPQDNCAELEAEVFTLREEVERLRRDTDTPAPASCPQASRLLDLALDVIRGKITGLSADQIETLRGIS